MRKNRHIKSGTFASVVHAYLVSPKFDSLADNTRTAYRRMLILAERPELLGAYDVAEMRPALVQAFLDAMADRPGAQYVAKTALRAVERWAIVRDLLPYPITTGTETVESDGGHKPWTEEQVAYAEQRAPPDLARAITLASNTGQRRSDLVKMRWTDLEIYEGRPGINVTQVKTGLQIWIPLTQDLSRVMARWERRPGFILLNNGFPWTADQLSNHWLDWRDQRKRLARRGMDFPLAGLVIHGLRATAVVRLRRAGATTGQIANMVGMSEQTVNRYCRLSVQRDNALAAVIHLDRTDIERAKSKGIFSRE
jgi:integrase